MMVEEITHYMRSKETSDADSLSLLILVDFDEYGPL